MQSSIPPATLLFVMAALAMPSSHAADRLGIDLITMRNGDIHNARVAQEQFRIDTGHGDIIIPYASMQSLHPNIHTHTAGDLVQTREGDRFSGRLKQRKLTILRPGEPDLPIAVDDIEEIIFSGAHAIQHSGQATDSVELHNGDLFAARVILPALALEDQHTATVTGHDSLHIIDIARHPDDDSIRTLVTLRSGQRLRGHIQADTVMLETRYGNTLELPLTRISSIALQVLNAQARPSYNHRSRFDRAAYLRDRMPDGSLGPEMLKLPGGVYSRGDHQGNGDDDERPTRQVRLRAFAIGLYETTFAEYDRFCAEHGCLKPDDSEWGRGRRPAINVSWEEAQEFTRWLSRKTGKRYRLPTDAEWEYAARAGTQTRFWWGNETGQANANCEGCAGLWDGAQSAPVGRFPPNPFGLHDTSGNVFEWVADCYHDSFAEAPADGAAVEKEGCGKRVIRGGAWSFPPHESRSANRWRDFPTRRSDDTGFRVVRELDGSGR